MNGRTRFGLALLFALSAGFPGGLRAQDQDPPDRIARVSYLRGDVSLQPGSANGDAAFAAAEVNYTLSAGDRLYTGQDGMSEMQSDNLALRLGRLSDVTLENFAQDYVRLGLAQGSVRVRSYALQTNGAIEVDTSNGSFTVMRAGDVRVSSYPGYGQRPDTTIVTVNAGQVRAVGDGMDTVIESGQTLRIDGNQPVQAGFVQMLQPDELDQFDQQRDEQRAAAAVQIRDQYVNPAMVGYDDLTQYGDWAPEPEYGRVWYPRQVEAEWSPYRNGHWAYIAPWGYTWVEAEPWGFAPFHYGRWARFGGRWGWVAGPPVVRPIYSPALVAFVGGSGFSLSIRVGGGGGVAAWFPLGPREPFVPWYRSSPGYVNRVNVSNLYNRNTVEVRNVYVNRTTNVYVNNTTINNITYVNRNVGTVAVPRQAFERGQSVRGAQMRVDPRQMQQGQVMTRPPEGSGRPAPTAGMAPARALPPVEARPQFDRRGAGGLGGRGSGPGGNGPGGNGSSNDGSMAQRFGQPTGPAQGRPQPSPQPPVRTQGQTQIPVAPPTRIEARPVPGVKPPGGMRGPNQGNNPDMAPNQQRPGQQAAPQQQPGRGQDIAQPVGGGRNVRPAEQIAPPAQVPQGSIPVRPPGGMRGPNPGNNLDLPPNQQRPNPPQQGQQQPGRTPGGQDLAAPVGGGRNSRPADENGPRPSVPAPAAAPVNRPAPQGYPDQGQRPSQVPPAQQQVRPQPTPAPQQQVPRQERPAPPSSPQVRPGPGPQPMQRQERPAPPSQQQVRPAQQQVRPPQRREPPPARIEDPK